MPEAQTQDAIQRYLRIDHIFKLKYYKNNLFKMMVYVGTDEITYFATL